MKAYGLSSSIMYLNMINKKSQVRQVRPGCQRADMREVWVEAIAWNGITHIHPTIMPHVFPYSI